MFAELAAIGSALSAINSAISTLKESKQNAEDAASLLGKFGNTTQRLDKWEKKTKSKRPLTPKEAMDLSLQRRKIKQTENKLKDHLLMILRQIYMMQILYMFHWTIIKKVICHHIYLKAVTLENHGNLSQITFLIEL